jgi:hypothetical protein
VPHALPLAVMHQCADAAPSFPCLRVHVLNVRSQVWWLRSTDDTFTCRLALVATSHTYSPKEPVFRVSDSVDTLSYCAHDCESMLR